MEKEELYEIVEKAIDKLIEKLEEDIKYRLERVEKIKEDISNWKEKTRDYLTKILELRIDVANILAKGGSIQVWEETCEFDRDLTIELSRIPLYFKPNDDSYLKLEGGKKYRIILIVEPIERD